jgi:AraC-like DNA-binding protein
MGERIATTSDLAVAQAALARITPRVILRSRDVDVPLRAQIHVLVLGQTRLCQSRFRARTQLTTVGDRYYHVVVPLEGNGIVHVAGGSVLRIDEASGLVVPPTTGFDIICSREYSQVAICFPQDLVHQELNRLTGAAVDRPIGFALVLDLSAPAHWLWRHLLAEIEASSRQPHGLLPGGLPSRRLERRLLKLLLTKQPHALTQELRAPAPTVVQRAIDLIEGQPEHLWTVYELAAGSGCGVRALQSSFQKSAGVTPIEYVRWVRLNRVHEGLQEPTSDASTVTDVAADWGFSHMGRFSAAYYAEFGEHPNETLRAARQR